MTSRRVPKTSIFAAFFKFLIPFSNFSVFFPCFHKENKFMYFQFSMKYIENSYHFYVFDPCDVISHTQNPWYFENGWIFLHAVFCFRLVFMNCFYPGNKNMGCSGHARSPLLSTLTHLLQALDLTEVWLLESWQRKRLVNTSPIALLRGPDKHVTTIKVDLFMFFNPKAYARSAYETDMLHFNGWW